MGIKFKFLLTFFLIYNHSIFSQSFILEKDETIDLLLDKKFKANNVFSTYTNFSIQLISSEKPQAETIYNKFTKKYPSVDATIIYSQPNYKVIVGNYRNKIDAVYFLKSIRNEYPDAFVVRLKK